MKAEKAMRSPQNRSWSGSIKSQFLVLILGSVLLALIITAGLAVLSINTLGKSVLEINNMATAEPFVVDQVQAAMANNLRSFILSRIGPISLLILGVILSAGVFWINRIVHPLNQMIESGQSIRREGSANFPKEAPGEVGLLSHELDESIKHLHLRQAILENQNVELLLAKEKISTQLITIAHLAREITSFYQLDHFLARSVNLIRDRFKYYHVAIFTIDPSGQYAVLKAASGDAGKKMLAMKHRLKVNQSSIVGWVANTGLLRLVPDVERDAAYFRNPLIPETRSEIALPLHISQRTIGVLDIHNNVVEGFDEEDALVLQIMADQISIAIDKANWLQQYQETQEKLVSVRERAGSPKYRSWVPEQQTVGYAYDFSGVQPLEKGEEINLETQSQGNRLSLPLKVRGEVIAMLDLWPEKDALSAQEENLIEEIRSRLSQAIESAQLFEDTQVRVRRERVLNQFVSNLSRSMDLDVLLQQAVKELSKMPNVNEVSIVIQPSSNKVADMSNELSIKETG
jgi:GAF domain-containing protein